MLRAQNLKRVFGDVLAVDQLDLKIAPGEVFGFLGPNGAGKTTTVRMLAGLIAPTSGRASVNGFDVVKQAQKVRASVGVLTETPGLYQKLNAIENLRLFARLHSLSDYQPRVQMLLEMLDLWDRREEPVGGFSKGMRQKLAIARTLLHQPPVVFLDEPTSALDPVSAKVVRDFIETLKDEGRTIFICTHNLYEAERLCDRIGIIKTSLISLGTPDELKASLYDSAVIVRLKQVDEATIALCQALQCVSTAEVYDEANQIRLEVEDLDDATPAIVRALVAAGADILSVEPEEQSLEAVYLDLIADDSTDTDADTKDDPAPKGAKDSNEGRS